MTIHAHLDTFHGLPVRWVGLDPATSSAAPDTVAWRVQAPYAEDEPTLQQRFEELLARVEPTRIRALVIGWWGPGWDGARGDIPIRMLAEAADRLPALEAIFLGDIVAEESEISWIEQDDVTPLLDAYPRLRRLEVRGGTGLRLRPVTHDALEVLRFETGGLPASVARAVGESSFPALRHLELWLGSEDYSGDSRPADWTGILDGSGLPALRHLGLQDSDIQDEVCAAVAAAPVVARLESLNLSMGVLTDTGAEALLSGRPLTHLRSLDLSHHYLSEAMTQRLRAALPGVELDLSGRQDAGKKWRYVAVSE
ncbi:STM4015 family protein [Nonomuraea rhodomycinica]|uniref:STM4015 family protein n=1 Tax=Nonomuraea rhodomycinica TaxID=1712872 RepID=A0A7Y6IJF6_9ACTN|nr:STM4015 family protein [Nonomuraea rhodomycinica]NUW39252.1 STM4015 family protein [Nonomuraea rhodomycinica]